MAAVRRLGFLKSYFQRLLGCGLALCTTVQNFIAVS